MTIIPILILLIIISAVFSGLTIGMFSLGVTGLERKARLGDEKAARVLQIRKEGNFLLCTLLLGNVAINSAITLVSTKLPFGDGMAAGLISTGLIFLFGEVLPQAVFSRHALDVGYYTAWLVRGFMLVMWPVAKPLSMALDFLLGKEFPSRYDRRELTALIEEHEGGSVDSDEKRIILGAMQFSGKRAKDIMTPAPIVFYLDEDIIINETLLHKIRDERYSRIPVVSGTRDTVVGVLFAKDLIGFDISQQRSVGDVCVRTGILAVRTKIHLDTLLGHMTKNKVHISFVYDDFGTLVGVVTLEDIIEEILDVEIMDETDTIADLRASALKEENIIQ